MQLILCVVVRLFFIPRTKNKRGFLLSKFIKEAIMSGKFQVKRLSQLAPGRISGFFQNCTPEELITIIEDIKILIRTDDTESPKDKEKYISYITMAESVLNGKLQEEQKETDYIDTSKFKPMTTREIIDILSLTIKRDEDIKLITFLCMLSAFTKEDQFNISFNGPSSSGKSFIALQVSKLFPDTSIMKLSGASPTAFFHEQGKLDPDNHTITVDLEGKIIIFLDQQNTLLLQKIRSLLSHDEKLITFKITDKNQKGGNKTKTIIIKGFPAVIFCSASLTMDEQECTRFLLLSPEISPDKLSEAVAEKILRGSNPFAYTYKLETNKARSLLKERIIALKQEAGTISDFIIPQNEMVKEMFLERIKIHKPRHSRDIERIMAFSKILAYVNVWFRKREGSAVIVDESDIKEAFRIWDTISEPQDLNLPPYINNFYNEIILPGYIEKNRMFIKNDHVGLTRSEIIHFYYKKTGMHLAEYKLRTEIILMLETAGLIIQQSDPADHMHKLVVPAIFADTDKVNNL